LFKVTVIDKDAFYNKGFTSVVIPDTVIIIGVTHIYDSAFTYNPLETPLEILVIPASLAKADWDGIYQTSGLFAHAFSLGSSINSITFITLPDGIDVRVLKFNFGESFVNFRVNQNRASGIYIRRGPIWIKASTIEAAQYLKKFETKTEQARKEAEAKQVVAARV
jgi:hypothetical protein